MYCIIQRHKVSYTHPFVFISPLINLYLQFIVFLTFLSLKQLYIILCFPFKDKMINTANMFTLVDLNLVNIFTESFSVGLQLYNFVSIKQISKESQNTSYGMTQKYFFKTVRYEFSEKNVKSSFQLTWTRGPSEVLSSHCVFLMGSQSSAFVNFSYFNHYLINHWSN